MKKVIACSAIATASLLLMQQCASPPPGMPEVAYGSLRITAMDTASIRSIFVDLDDVKYGRHPNPCVLVNLIVGVHKLLVYDDSNAVLSGTVEVLRDRRTEITVSLMAEGPYVGRIAPRFSVANIDDQSLSLDAMKGKVVLLAFFEHT